MVYSIEPGGNHPVVSLRQWCGGGHSVRGRDVPGESLHEVAREFFLKFVFKSLQVEPASINTKTRVIESWRLDQNSSRDSCGRTAGQELNFL